MSPRHHVTVARVKIVRLGSTFDKPQKVIGPPAAAYADFNGDGCLDLYLTNMGRSAQDGEQARLFQNSCTWANNWLTIKTVGTDSNRDGIGARIKLTAGGNTQIREVAAGSSNKSQNMLPVHFGLGKSEIVDSIQIHWPSGKLQTLSNVAPNQVLIITEP